MLLGDAHRHLGSVGAESPGASSGVDKDMIIVLNGTSQRDWTHVLAEAGAPPRTGDGGRCLAQLGLHPWFVPADREGVEAALEDLRRLLEERPEVGLGECGLDKSGKWAATFDAQLHAFKRQIGLAVALGRPLSVHCVRCAVQVYEIVKADVGGRVPVLLHGWSGSAEHTKTFRRLNHVYFSLNMTLINRKARRKAVEMVREVPFDRILLESDGPDGRLRSRDDWAAWFRECGAECPSGVVEDIDVGDGEEDPLDFRDTDLDRAICGGSSASIRLMAHAVGAAIGRSPGEVMSTSLENIRRIFVFTTTVCEN